MVNRSDYSSTKVIGTIGPACADPRILKKNDRSRTKCRQGPTVHMVNRMNFLGIIEYVNRTSAELGIHLPILADLSGPKIRLGKLDHEIYVKTGEFITLCSDPDDASPGKLIAGYPGLADDISPGHKILIDDGLIQMEVIEVSSPDIKCRVMNDGILKSRKGLIYPVSPISLSALTEKGPEGCRFSG